MFLSKKLISKKLENIFDHFKQVIKPKGLKNRFGSVLWKFTNENLERGNLFGEFLGKVQEHIINKILSFGLVDISKEKQDGVKRLIKEVVRRERVLIEIYEASKRASRSESKELHFRGLFKLLSLV